MGRRGGAGENAGEDNSFNRVMWRILGERDERSTAGKRRGKSKDSEREGEESGRGKELRRGRKGEEWE